MASTNETPYGTTTERAQADEVWMLVKSRTRRVEGQTLTTREIDADAVGGLILRLEALQQKISHKWLDDYLYATLPREVSGGYVEISSELRDIIAEFRSCSGL